MLTEGLHPSLKDYSNVSSQEIIALVGQKMVDYPLVRALGMVFLGFSPLCSSLAKGLNQFPEGEVQILGEGVEMDEPFKVSWVPGKGLVYLPMTYRLVLKPPKPCSCTGGLVGELTVFPKSFEITCRRGMRKYGYDMMAKLRAADGVWEGQRMGWADVYFGQPVSSLGLLEEQDNRKHDTLFQILRCFNQEVRAAKLDMSIKEGTDLQLGLA